MSADSQHSIRHYRVHKLIERRGIEACLKVERHETRPDGLTVTRLKVLDGYHQPAYRLERSASRLFAAGLNRYLKKRPDMAFEHSRNLPRKILYTLPAFRSFSAFFPGALALEPIQNPESKRLITGVKMDMVTRRLFRHGLDAVAIRSRTLVGAWIAQQHAKQENLQTISWVSLAGGTGAPSLLMLVATGLPLHNCRLSVIDLDEQALLVAQELAAAENLSASNMTLVHGDIFDPASLAAAAQPASADVVDLMGIFEYLSNEQCAHLLAQAYSLLKPDSLIILGNMRRKHRQLDLHKRGIGWPGVIPRSAQQVAGIIDDAKLKHVEFAIFQPDDSVYNVFALKKG